MAVVLHPVPRPDEGPGAARGEVAPAGPAIPVGPGGPEPGCAPGTIHVVDWPDPVIDRLGYDPRSLYVETFWLGILGPTSTWMLRRLAARFDDEPAGFDVDVADMARALGLGDRTGRHAPFRRALARCVTFRVARSHGPDAVAVRRRLPPLSRRHLDRLPPSLRHEHERWVAAARRGPALDEARRRSRRLALGLAQSGESERVTEAHLVRWRVHPALAHEAARWSATVLREGGAGPAPDREAEPHHRASGDAKSEAPTTDDEDRDGGSGSAIVVRSRRFTSRKHA
ncbi:MAG TPA: hypothetical protein VMB72_00495 [Acidimicrobiales bacterium]|nr:hypothetical protein [Acidimicrobiales bacterium]